MDTQTATNPIPTKIITPDTTGDKPPQEEASKINTTEPALEDPSKKNDIEEKNQDQVIS